MKTRGRSIACISPTRHETAGFVETIAAVDESGAEQAQHTIVINRFAARHIGSEQDEMGARETEAALVVERLEVRRERAPVAQRSFAARRTRGRRNLLGRNAALRNLRAH